MFGTHPLLLLLAGLGAGLTGSIAGLASLISYPALLGLGLSPISANVTNTVALIFNSVGSTWGSKPELRGQGPWLRRLSVAALLGGALGGGLLLATPSGSFALVVPVLIAVASAAIFAPTPARLAAHLAAGGHPSGVTVATFAIAVYGGYFGAAAGILLLAALLTLTGQSIARCTGFKNLLLGVANTVAAVAFAIFGPVRWSVVVPLAAGLLIGGRLGPAVVRRAPVRPLRIVIALCGLGLAVHLGIDAYT